MNASGITGAMTLLDVVHAHPATEPVFRSRDGQAGVCLLCAALFETLESVAATYGLDLDALLADLNRAAALPAADH
ncbi:MAG: DUF1858 domain-containing protein [Pseudodesulfovibrio sp.]|uniref:DUF1858 domain-containing protein n=1 Tax=Pseudodesulfovibrio aespoeensis (strain ATCC 700646 / DSM 10631 / Aspo-2) TaxID=643562 RepID=E6VRV7_PSEA9|nr:MULTISPECIES: DUF1858 domain-containing protein [Pseudodesulfovibrio]MBU4191784.1 DUF1858 domain-containing protein [Pseudomonadota bacterium]ADU64244.1 hypothetical protein Daes_3255 [Pseudodesulfovibrio aespoeensis Aspo-2]MBU4243012.1 DUF1858 domain-containing protein [Pseudomonadota bacterium]MBU4380293.1 DUF1858 domain-containing protein [Pseudomonadota bacterium]MBU4474839.1 DUF1858 domain-containing protein [Pseudomonadota bacterium]